MKTLGGRIACATLAPVYKRGFANFVEIHVPKRLEPGEKECIIDYLRSKPFSRRRSLCAGNALDLVSASRVQLPFGRRVIPLRGVKQPDAADLLAAQPHNEQRLELSVVSIQAQEKAQ
jgi:hypothetical protein